MLNRCNFYLMLLLSVHFVQSAPPLSAAENETKLAVVIVVDQMRADHLTRFAGAYSGGLASLIKYGTVFTDAHQDHAMTATSVGHACISTGVFPSRHGIVGNNWYERAEKKGVYSVDDPAVQIVGASKGDGRSPHRLQVNTLGDWLKEQSPQSKVFSVARKDRAAILMAGFKADGVYWYNDSNAHFVTSTFYRQELPEWVNAFNQAKHADRFYQEGWHKLKPEETYFMSREDRFPSEADGEHTTFPHEFGKKDGQPDKRYYGQLTGTPFGDEYALDFARAIVMNEKLGQDEHLDLLFVGCSAADGIGHSFGPLSQECEDYYLRLDGYLDRFFLMLDETVGADSYLAVLTSDHGVLPMPEELARRGFDSKRVMLTDIKKDLLKIGRGVQSALKLSGNPISDVRYGVVLDYKVMPKNMAASELETALAKRITELPYVEQVWRRSELETGQSNGDAYFERYLKNYFPTRGPDLYVRTKEFYLNAYRETGTSHGSPYDYDTHIPLVFAGAGIKSGKIDEKVRSIDIVPTLAALLQIELGAEVDGRSLKALMADEQQ